MVAQARRPVTVCLAILWLATIFGVVYHTPDLPQNHIDGWLPPSPQPLRSSSSSSSAASSTEAPTSTSEAPAAPKGRGGREEKRASAPTSTSAAPVAPKGRGGREEKRAVLLDVEKLLERQLARLTLRGAGGVEGGKGSDSADQAEHAAIQGRLAALRSTTVSANSSYVAPSATRRPASPAAAAAALAGAFAILASTDAPSIKSALAVCDMLIASGTRHDVLIISPNLLPLDLADAVAKAGCKAVALGVAPYPPKFKPLRPSFRVCWHKLRLWTFTQYSAIVALDADVVVLRNIDALLDDIARYSEATAGAATAAGSLASPDHVLFAAADQTPRCESCDASVSGAPNGGVFGLRPSQQVYDQLVERSKRASPWYGDLWSYSEQELLSIFFLVEQEVHNTRLVWLDEHLNFFACNYACPAYGNTDNFTSPHASIFSVVAAPQPPPAYNIRTPGGAAPNGTGGAAAAAAAAEAGPSVVHFVGVRKPSKMFIEARRRSEVVKGLALINPHKPWHHALVLPLYRAWFRHYANAMRTSGLGAKQLRWTDPYTRRQKRWMAFVHIPKTAGSALISMLMERLYGDNWQQSECSQGPPSSHRPPLCATFGEWVEPRRRRGTYLSRCTTIGCLGHLPLLATRAALGKELVVQADIVVLLRHPVKVFVSEFHYIKAQLRSSEPSLQFVQDPHLLSRMAPSARRRRHTTPISRLEQYVDYVTDWHERDNTTSYSAFRKKSKKEREREKLGLLDQDVSVDVALFQKQAKFHFSAEGSANGGGGGRAEEGEGEGEGGGGGEGEGEVGHGFGVGFGEVAFGGQFGNAINRQTFFLTGASPRDMRRRPEEVYREAVAQLVNIEFVGVAEQMDASAELLACTLGVPSLRGAGGSAVPRRNVGTYAPIEEEDPRVLERIERALALDLRTYEYAVAMLRHRLDVLPFMRAHFQFC